MEINSDLSNIMCGVIIMLHMKKHSSRDVPPNKRFFKAKPQNKNARG